MTTKQKQNIARFKKVQAEAKKLRSKNKKLTQAEAVKQAWAIQYSKEGKTKKVGNSKVNQNKYLNPIFNPYQPDIDYSAKIKKAAKKSKQKKSAVKVKRKRPGELHTDTKSHNVNIRVVSGTKTYKGYNINITPFGYYETYLINEGRFYKADTLLGIKTAINKDIKKSISGWKKGKTAIIEKGEKPYKKLRNIRVTRNTKKTLFDKPGTFKNFTAVSGINEVFLKELTTYIKVLNEKEKSYNFHKKMSTNKERSIDLRRNDKQMMKVLKTQILNLKKHITKIKRQIK